MKINTPSVSMEIKKVRKASVHITASFSEDAVAALDTLMERWSIEDRKPVKTSEALRRAVLLAERMTRRGEEE